MADQQQYFCNKEGCDFRGTLEQVTRTRRRA